MALTGNFSLRYPTDLSLVDIAQDIQNLAEDVDTQLILKTRGPTSSTDNTIPRFDGTTGKVLQSSYIAISDSGSFITDLTIKKNTPMLTLYSDYSYARLTLRSDGGNEADILLRGGYLGAYDRWVVGKTNEVEGGGNAGSNFAITAYDNTGPLSTPLKITRSTGKVNLGSVGATAGLELGSSGPRMMSGTGSPEGSVTAPVGSIWFQTDSTVGVTHWRKASGTGNTGWKVMEGDTGWRDVSASMTAASTGITFTYTYIRRVNNTVEWSFTATIGTAAGHNFVTPTGFGTGVNWAIHDFNVVYHTNMTGYKSVLYRGANNGSFYSGATDGLAVRGVLTYTTTQDWPTTLPGTAA